MDRQTQTAQILLGQEVPNEISTACATLFSEHYGVWGERSQYRRRRVTLSAQRFRQNYLAAPEDRLVYVRLGDVIVGHATFREFRVSIPNVIEGNAIWITQLVVHSDHRQNGIARQLLAFCVRTGVALAGLVSSHPAAVKALQRAVGIEEYNHNLIRAHGHDIARQSAVHYLQLPRINFPQDRSVVVTDFWVDHSEINHILQGQIPGWTFGEIHDGEEFLAIAAIAEIANQGRDEIRQIENAMSKIKLQDSDSKLLDVLQSFKQTIIALARIQPSTFTVEDFASQLPFISKRWIQAVLGSLCDESSELPLTRTRQGRIFVYSVRSTSSVADNNKAN